MRSRTAERGLVTSYGPPDATSPDEGPDSSDLTSAVGVPAACDSLEVGSVGSDAEAGGAAPRPGVARSGGRRRTRQRVVGHSRRSVLRVVSTLLGSGTLRAAMIYGSAGVGFALANLLLARALEPREYGLVALVIALFNISVPIAPIGADGIVLRRHLPLDRPLLARVALTSIVTGTLVLAVGLLVYGLTALMASMVFLGVATGGVGTVAASYFQGTGRRLLALLISQGQNLVLLSLVGVVILTGMHSATVPIAGMTAFYVVGALFLCTLGLRERRKDVDRVAAEAPFPLREALSYAGVVAVSYGLVQLERLVLPRLLGLEALALFGVLAAVVGSGFRVLLMSVEFTLVPVLRRATSVEDRRRVMRREVLAVGGVALVATVALWVFTPVVVRAFVGDKYVLPSALIAASLVGGWFKLLGAFGRSSVAALASARQLSHFNVAGWLAVCASLAGAVLGVPWGLTGVVWGLSAGWLALLLIAIYYAAPHFRDTAMVAVPTTQPDLPDERVA